MLAVIADGRGQRRAPAHHRVQNHIRAVGIEADHVLKGDKILFPGVRCLVHRGIAPHVRLDLIIASSATLMLGRPALLMHQRSGLWCSCQLRQPVDVFLRALECVLGIS